MKRLFLKKFILLVVLLSAATAAFPQSGSISGKITDEKNFPLPGATIRIKGSNGGASSDGSGNFRLSGLSNGSVTITINFVGYQGAERTVNVSGDTRLDVQLSPSSETLGEVVVIGYGSQQKKEVTGAITTVTSKDFQTGSITSPDQLLIGKVAGVSITSNSGQPGVGSTIRIRGGASLSASNDPLIVIDGVPVSNSKVSGASNPLSLINPADIESFTVLKDASATAIYGSRASNGVILITTKKGKNGEPKFAFTTQLSTYSSGRQVDVMSADELRSYVQKNGTAAQIGLLGNANTNWQDEIYQTSQGYDNNLSVTGGFKNIPYRVSAGFLNQKGVLLTDMFQRASGAINLSPKLFTNHLKIDLNVKGSSTRSRFANQGAIGAASAFDPTQPVYATNGFGNFFEWTSGTVPNPNATRNPVSMLETKRDKSNVQRSFGNAQLDYSFHFLPELHANINLGYDVQKGEGTIYIPYYAAQSFAGGGTNNQYLQTITNKVGEAYLNYVKDIKAIKGNINLTAGYGYYDFLTHTTNFASYKADNTLVAGSTPAFPFDKPQTTLISYYGRAIYTLNNKYIFSGSLRTDGSSKFAEENRWGVFPSAAFTWRMSDESFAKNWNKLSDLKLRLSYGITGQQEGIDYFGYLAVYNSSVNVAKYQLGNTFYNMYAPSAYDKSLKWEQTETYNAGLDYGFFGNRLTGAIDVYFKKTKDLLSSIPIPSGSNFTNILLTNVGNVENKGVELSITGQPVKTKDLTWDASMNFTFNTNKITNLTSVSNPTFLGNAVGSISGGTGQTIQINSVGYNTNAFFVFKQVYDSSGKPIEGVYEDLNKDGVINQYDQYRYKSAAPKALIGFSSSLGWKKWSLSTVLRSNIGNYMYDNVSANLGVQRNILNPSGFLGNATKDFFTSGFVNNQYQSDYYVKNASFLRMDNLGLSYTVNNLWKSSKTNLVVSGNIQNVFVLTKYKGLDPEVSSGIDNNFYPRPRTFVLGLNLGF